MMSFILMSELESVIGDSLTGIFGNPFLFGAMIIIISIILILTLGFTLEAAIVPFSLVLLMVMGSIPELWLIMVLIAGVILGLAILHLLGR